MTTSAPDRAALLSTLFSDRLAAAWSTSVAVIDARRLTGGASRETWALTVRREDAGELRVIARIDTVAKGSLALEVEAISAAAKVGVPVPEVYDSGTDDQVVGGAFMLVAFVDGETIPRKLLRDEEYAGARDGLARTMGRTLARIHTADLPDSELLTTVADPLGDMIRDNGLGVPVAPGLALGLRELRRRAPSSGRTTLVHGDFRLGNLLIDGDGLAAVLDWELVHRGDPVEDLGWLCAKVWRFGSPLPAGGVGTREELLDGYAEEAGWRPTDEHLAWWELFATVKWGMMCQRMTTTHTSGAQPSVERAAIGRRTCEQEFDVLLALGLDEPHQAPPLPDYSEGTDLYGWPNAAQLADGVSHFLTTSAMPLGGALGFEARVAANVVAMLQREALLGPEARRTHAAQLTSLGVADDAELSLAIERGDLDARWAEVTTAVRAAVRDRVAVANPRHLERPV
ncbi:phosphotransferase family protein [Nocardioides insulae]|uniref:phosphotransferase family protein n=1 Tax=Nocardioides insulae TaxID=394734 RepID=UPI00041CEA39|nr:phosphotransferase family protein [Nocardioides insulae]